MDLNERTMHTVNNIQGVIKFVGQRAVSRSPCTRKRSTRFSESRLRRTTTRVTKRSRFHLGQVVEVIEGPFSDFSGTIKGGLPGEGQGKGRGVALRSAHTGRVGLHAVEGLLGFHKRRSQDTKWRRGLSVSSSFILRGGRPTRLRRVGPALGQKGVNIMEFCKQFNSRTQQQTGVTIPVEITVYADRSFSFITKTPPAIVPD